MAICCCCCLLFWLLLLILSSIVNQDHHHFLSYVFALESFRVDLSVYSFCVSFFNSVL